MLRLPATVVTCSTDMKFPSSSISRQIHSQNACKFFGSLFSTETLHTRSSSLSLFDRVVDIRDPKTPVLPLLEQWVHDGGSVGEQELRRLVRILKGFCRYDHALQISKWMSDRRYLNLAPNDMAIRLSLIHKVYSLEQAEYFFNSMSKNLKTYTVYAALLSCYMQESCVEKAEHLMDKMRETEMEEKGIPRDIYTMRNLMAAYVASSNISGLERVLNQVEDSSELKADWNMYSLAADGYLKVGLNEKALLALQKMEQAMLHLSRAKMPFGFLLSLYAKAGNKNELYRVWNKYKEPNENSLYSKMITSLAKLDDLEGAEKIYEDWESQCSEYDFRVLNRLISAYSRRGLFEKAESLIHRASEGSAPYASTWNIVATGCMQHDQMAKAVEMLKKALSVGRRDWKPDSQLVNACLDYLEGKGDLQGMEDMARIFKKLGTLTRSIYYRLVRCYIAAGKSVSEGVERMKNDGFDTDEETLRTLDS